MAVMPGAVWRPIPVSSSRPKRLKGRGVCLHVAVSESASLFNFFSTAPVDSHFYVNAAGVIEQYVDTDLQAYANLAGNSSLISVETQGGVVNPESEPWTDAQLEALARIAQWAHDTEGVPLQVMPNSLPTSRGIGYHKLGVDPYRVPNGEVWSASYGKTCPGLAKVGQVASVVRRAIELSTPPPSPPPSPVEDDDMKFAAYRTPDLKVWLAAPGIWWWVPSNEFLGHFLDRKQIDSAGVVPVTQAQADLFKQVWLSGVPSASK